jgi:hypothetical protein
MQLFPPHYNAQISDNDFNNLDDFLQSLLIVNKGCNVQNSGSMGENLYSLLADT